MTFPKDPEASEGSAQEWGLGEVVVGAVVGLFLAILLTSVVEIAWSGGTLPKGNSYPGSPTEKLVATAVDLIALWIGLAGAAVFASRTKGSGSLARDFGFSIRPVDLPVGIALGVGCQLILVNLLYLPWEMVDHHLRHQLSQPAHQLTGGIQGAELALLGVLLAVGAPIVEELYFRGLLLSALLKRLQPSFGMRAGLVYSVASSAVIFGLFHLLGGESLQFLGLAALGAVLAAAVRRTGRLGTSIIAHAAFNAVTVISLATIH